MHDIRTRILSRLLDDGLRGIDHVPEVVLAPLRLLPIHNPRLRRVLVQVNRQRLDDLETVLRERAPPSLRGVYPRPDTVLVRLLRRPLDELGSDAAALILRIHGDTKTVECLHSEGEQHCRLRMNERDRTRALMEGVCQPPLRESA
jgi:hypothetical protein